MIEHEAKAGSNVKTFMAFMILLILVLLSAATCCYIVFNFDGWIALRCLLMLLIGFFLVDILVTRTLYCFVIAIVLWCK